MIFLNKLKNIILLKYKDVYFSFAKHIWKLKTNS